jgi:hypothetical protein
VAHSTLSPTEAGVQSARSSMSHSTLSKNFNDEIASGHFFTIFWYSFFNDNIQVTSQSFLTTDGQSASLSWYQTSNWDPRPIFLSCSQKLSSDICGYFSMERLS